MTATPINKRVGEYGDGVFPEAAGVREDTFRRNVNANDKAISRIGCIGFNANFTQAIGITTVVWITKRTDGLDGSGTNLDPWDGSTAAKLQAILHDATKCPENTLINLGPGIFDVNIISGPETAGTGIKPRSGWILNGASRVGTTLRATGSIGTIQFDLAIIKSDSAVATDNVTVQNMTLDCAWQNLVDSATDIGALGSSTVNDGATQNGSATIKSATAQFLHYIHFHRAISGTGIPAGTKILRTPATTIAAGSNGAALPQATINAGVTTDFADAGTILVETSAGKFQVVTYTGKTSSTFTGCSGGTGTMKTGGSIGTITQAVMSANATATATGVSVTIGPEKNVKVGGANLYGSNCRYENLRCTNSYGTLANSQENFSLAISAPIGGAADGGYMEGCLVDTPYGNYGSPYAIFGGNNFDDRLTNSKVAHCWGYGHNNGLNSGFTTGGVNLAGLKDCQAINNNFVDCGNIAYIDTYSCENMLVDNNTGVRMNNGVNFVQTTPMGWAGPAWTKKHITITRNTVSLQNREAGAKYGVRLQNDTTTGDRISGNTITLDRTGLGTDNGYWGLYLSSHAKMTIEHNVIDPACNNLNEAPVTATIRGNRNADGTPLSWATGAARYSLDDNDPTLLNNQGSNLIGALAASATASTTGAVLQWEITATDYVIVAGDRLRYDVMIDEASSSMRPWAVIKTSDGNYAGDADQNGLLTQTDRADLSKYALGRWYSRDMLLSAAAGKTAQKFAFGERASEGGLGVAGAIKFYFRNVRIVGANGALKRAYFTGTEAAGAALIVTNTTGSTAGPVLNIYSSDTGWTAWTGTGSKATRDVATATTANNAAAIKSLIDALLAKGIISA